MTRSAGLQPRPDRGAPAPRWFALSSLLLAVLPLASCAGQRPARLWRDPPPSFSSSDPFSARVDAARRLLDDGLFDQARTAIESLCADGATHPLVPLMRAQLAEHDQDWPTCIAWAHKAVEASPGWGEPRILLARACLEAGRVGDADSAFADVDRLLPDSPWGPYGRAWVAARRLDQARAGELADEAIRRDPDHVPSLILRAGVARLTGDPATEERLLRRAVALGEPDAGPWARLGELAEAAGRRLDAARAYERAWDLRPSRDVARRRLELARLAGDAEATELWVQRTR
jgi:cytochrome c-type biogenesis protein CcmH/NrfG